MGSCFSRWAGMFPILLSDSCWILHIYSKLIPKFLSCYILHTKLPHAWHFLQFRLMWILEFRWSKYTDQLWHGWNSAIVRFNNTEFQWAGQQYGYTNGKKTKPTWTDFGITFYIFCGLCFSIPKQVFNWCQAKKSQDFSSPFFLRKIYRELIRMWVKQWQEPPIGSK